MSDALACQPGLLVEAVMRVVTVAGCSQTVSGTRATGAVRPSPIPTRSYGYVDDRCGLLVDGSIQRGDRRRPHRAALPQRCGSASTCWPVARRWSYVTFSWCRDRRASAANARLPPERGATVTEKDVERHQSVSGASRHHRRGLFGHRGGGHRVLSWWVQFRGQRNGDPCKDAEKLLTATLQSDM